MSADLAADRANADHKIRVARWRYVVPNAITMASMLLGLAGISLAVWGDAHEGAWLVVLCVLLDKLDGTAARLLKSTSAIGQQLDSFSDFVTFGIAPAFIVWAAISRAPLTYGDVWTGEITRWVLVALMAAYVMCTAIRLAKFNVLAAVIPEDGPKVFYGLPSTFAGGLVLVIFLIGFEQGWDSVVRWTPIGAAVLGAMMISNMPLPKLVLRESRAFNIFQGLNVAMGFFCGVFRVWPEYIFISVMIYALVGFTWGQIHRHELMPQTTDLDPYPSE